jgi:creatinine amidohydrolase/Fe(II)-dependent formamide hydrolase-like protein
VRSRFLLELTTPEVEAYLAQGGKTALLPVGCVEMHGPHQPIGTDSIVAKAFALRIAQAANGIVLPEVHYTWAGSTDGFAGTIAVEPELVYKTVEAIALKTWRMGLRRLLVLSIHHGNHYPLYLFVRQIYEKHHIPTVYVNPMRPLDEESRALFAGDYARSMEASLVLAALHILGQPDLYCESEMRYDDQPPPRSEAYRQISTVGAVGSFMQDPRHHACPSKYVSLKRGLAFIDRQVRTIAPTLAHIDEYVRDTEEQGNQGWWRPEGTEI